MEHVKFGAGKVLIIEDEGKIRSIVKAALTRAGHTVYEAPNGQTGIESFKELSPQLVLLDFNMPGMNGLETLEKLREISSFVSVIFLTAKSSIADVVKGLDAGADDYICKPFVLGELTARVKTHMRMAYLTESLNNANQKLQELVEIDDLTGLFNMRSIYKKLDNEIKRASRGDHSIGVIMMDMDYFKMVNDNHDHLFGSYVLTNVGKIIKEHLRSSDFAARFGGDEFMVVLTNTTPEGAEIFCEKLRASIEDSIFESDEYRTKLTVSIGHVVTDIVKSGTTSKGLISIADRAMYKVKNSGRNGSIGYKLSECDGLEND